MKTLIIYGTKYGTTEKCSSLLRDKLKGEVQVVNIKTERLPDIKDFEVSEENIKKFGEVINSY